MGAGLGDGDGAVVAAGVTASDGGVAVREPKWARDGRAEDGADAAGDGAGVAGVEKGVPVDADAGRPKPAERNGAGEPCPDRGGALGAAEDGPGVGC